MIKKENLIALYPEAFPLTGPLRNAFTERLYNLFCGDGDIFSSYRNRTMFWRDGTWYLREDTLPEKLFKIRDEMQKYIKYPPVIPRVPNEFHDDSEFILDIFTPEELLV